MDGEGEELALGWSSSWILIYTAHGVNKMDPREDVIWPTSTIMVTFITTKTNLKLLPYVFNLSSFVRSLLA